MVLVYFKVSLNSFSNHILCSIYLIYIYLSSVKWKMEKTIKNIKMLVA